MLGLFPVKVYLAQFERRTHKLRIEIGGLQKPFLLVFFVGRKKTVDVTLLGFQARQRAASHKLIKRRLRGWIEISQNLPGQTLFEFGQVGKVACFGNIGGILQFAQIDHLRVNHDAAIL